MGILDELRDEAEKAKDLTDKQQATTADKERFYQTDLLPALQKLYAYFEELISHLEVIENPIVVDVYKSKFRYIGKLNQQDYKLATDQHGGKTDLTALTEVKFRFNCIHGENTKSKFMYEVNDINAMKLERQFLKDHFINFDERYQVTNNNRVQFLVEKRIPILFDFSINHDKQVIQLSVVNHEQLEKRTAFIAPKDLNDDYLDRLGRYILRKDNDLLKLEIDDTVKDQIKANLKASQQKRDEEMREMEALIKERERIAEEKTLKFKLKKFSAEKLDQLKNKLSKK